MRCKFFIIAVLLGLVVWIGTNNTVFAGTGLGIQPTKVSHTIEPGEIVSGVIRLSNASDEAIDVEVEVQDFVPTAGTQDIRFVKRAEGVTSVKDWITIGSPELFVFEKGESREIPYTIKAPPDAEPGSHFGVAFFTARKKNEGTGEMLKIGMRLGMMIYATVPGNFLQKGKILNFSAPKFIQKGPVPFKIKFENTGTVHFEPKGEIIITNIFGKAVGKAPVEGRAVLPTGARDLTAQWDVKSFLLGRYRAEIQIKDGEGNVLTAESVVFYAFPIWYIAGFLGFIIILFFGIKFLRKKLTFNISIKK